jgi:AmmeMemoRadiSam system protein B
MKWLLLTILLTLGVQAAERRPLALAGDFYPRSLQAIDKMLLPFFQRAHAPKGAKPRMLIVPHDRLPRSGLTAAIAYQCLRGHTYEGIILIGPYHAEMIPGAAVWTEGNWQGPWGDIAVDRPLAKAIRHALGPLQQGVHLHDTEHSLEIQLPFLQKIVPGCPIVPILISDNHYYQALAAAILPQIQGRDILIIISTDLSHFHPLADAQTIDLQTLQLIGAGDPVALNAAIDALRIELCGSAAVLTGLEIARQQGWQPWQTLYYATNAEVTHQDRSVVGYVAAVLY